MGTSLKELHAALGRVLAALDALEAHDKRAVPGRSAGAERKALWKSLMKANDDYMVTVQKFLNHPREPL